MPEPKITVILATYNSAATLERCLDSFRAQDYPSKELIIMDGGSSDGTRQIIESNKDILAYWESAPDSGIYNAWNKALPHATGDWIYFIGADDHFSGPGVLGEAARLLAGAYPAYRVAYGRVDLVKPDGRVWSEAGEPWDRAAFLREMNIPHQGAFQHRTLFSEYGSFDESYRIVGDYELLMRELKDKDALFLPGLKVAANCYGGVSSSPAYSLKAVREMMLARRKHGIPGLPWRLYWVYFKALARYLLSLVAGRAAAHEAANVYRRFSGRRPV